MQPDITTAAIAFFALGANLLGAVLLVLFNARNHEVRWFAVFEIAIALWLLSVGMTVLRPQHEVWGYLNLFAVTCMPGLFLASALAGKYDDTNWKVVLAAAASIPAIGLMWANAATDSFICGLLANAWHVIGWGGGTFVMAQQAYTGRASRGGHWSSGSIILLGLLLIAPMAVLIGIFTDADVFFLRGMPLITVAVQLLVFIGVSRMGFYNIDVRVARTGEVASRVAEHERLAVLGELAASIAHEVRNPLTGVRSLTQRIAADEVDADKRKRYAEVILEEVNRLERIVGNLLTTARNSTRQSWDGKSTPLQPLFEDVALLVDSRVRAANMQLNMHPTTLAAAASRQSLAQALLNLLLNAVQHSQATRIDVRAIQEGGSLDIIVSDNGTGVPADQRARIFEPFHSTGNGTGLGLSVVRSLARELEWQITIEDRAGGGAEFHIRIPDRVTA